MYVAAESLLVEWLKTAFPGKRVVTETPSDLTGPNLPCIKVTRFGGADDVITFDHANVDIDCFAESRDAARSLAEEVRHSLRFDLPSRSVAGGTVTRVTTSSAPTWAPYDNTSLRRFTAAYQVTIHSHV